MELAYITTILAFCACFIASFVGLKIVSRNLTSFVPDNNWRKDTFLPIYFTTFAAFLLLFGLNQINYDLIWPLHWVELLLAFAGTGLIYLVSLFKKTSRFTILAIVAGSIFCAVFLPREFMLFQSHLPFWADRLCLIILWVAFSWCFQYMNGIDGMASLQASTIVGGLFILSFLGGLPLLFGNFSIAFLGSLVALMLFNWYPAKLLLKPGACMSLGFLLGWMIVLSAREGTSSCALIYSMFFIVEILLAIVKTFIFSSATDKISDNTNYYLTNVSGLSPAVVCQNTAKLQMVLLIVGSFQVYAPNNYSLPLVATLLTVWLINRLRNWQEPDKSLKEINFDVIRDIKENVEDIKKTIK